MKAKFFLILTILTLFSVASANELTEDYLDIAKNYYSSNNIAKALEYTELVLSIEPNNAEACKLKEKLMPTAIPQANLEPITITNSVPESTQVVSVQSLDTTKTEYNSDYYNTKGMEFFDQKDYDTALQYFYKSLYLNKNNFLAYNNLAMTYWTKGNFEVAEKNFKIAHKKNKSYTQPLVNLGNLYLQKGNQQLALYYYKKAISSNPNDYLAYYYLGDYYRSKNNYPEAIKAYQEVIKIDKKYSQAYLKIAMSFFEIEEFEYCTLTLKKYLELNPESDYAYMLMAKSVAAVGKYNEAENYITTALMLRDCEEYAIEQAKIFYNMGVYDFAQKSFEKLLQKNENADFYNYLGLCYYKQQNLNSAILNFKKAIETDSLRSIYYYNLAQCYKSINDKINYTKYINTATKINPINHQDFIDLSYIYFDNSNVTYAINTLNDGIKKYPYNKSLYLSKLRIYEVINDSLSYENTKRIIDKKFNNYEEKEQQNKK